VKRKMRMKVKQCSQKRIMYVHLILWLIFNFRKQSVSQLSEESDVEERDGTKPPSLQSPGEVNSSCGLLILADPVRI
jgi:hypothetical protein